MVRNFIDYSDNFGVQSGLRVECLDISSMKAKSVCSIVLCISMKEYNEELVITSVYEKCNVPYMFFWDQKSFEISDLNILMESVIQRKENCHLYPGESKEECSFAIIIAAIH